MANTYKNIVITPNIGSSSDDPKIVFSGANTTVNTDITLRVYPTSNGTLSFEGAAGQLFSITNDLTGSIFSVNDVSGIPSIDVNADGSLYLAPYSGNVAIGSTTTRAKLTIGSLTSTSTASPDVIDIGGTYSSSAANNLKLKLWTDGSNFMGLGVSSNQLDYSLSSGSYSHNWYVGGTRMAYINSSGVNAPLFYDSDNTGYYVNPYGDTNLNNLIIQGAVASTTLSSAYNNAAIEVREYAFGGAQTDSWTYAPRIGFHWGGRVASQISMTSGGRITILNNPGTGTEAFECGNFYAPIFYDSDNTAYYVDPASTSSINNLTVSANLTVSSTGDLVITAGASVFANGGVGTSGQVLASNGTSPYWTTVSGGASLIANTTDTQTFYIPMSNATSGSWSNGVVANTKLYFVPSTGTLSATIFNSLSDADYKINVKTVENSLDIVSQLRGVSFNWKEDNRSSIGVIAQEVEKVLPELVTDHNQKKSVNYDGLIGVLIESIKELKEEIRILKQEKTK